MEVVGQTPIDPNVLEISREIDEDAMSIDVNPNNEPAPNSSVVRTFSAGNEPTIKPPTPPEQESSATPQAKKVSTPSRWSRGDLLETPLSTLSSGRKAKEQAATRLHDSIMPDVMKYQQEQKRKGGVLGTGRRRRTGSPSEEKPILSRKRTASVGAGSGSEDETKTGPKKGKKRSKPVVYLLITAYRDWVDNPQKEESDKVRKLCVGYWPLGTNDNTEGACKHWNTMRY